MLENRFLMQLTNSSLISERFLGMSFRIYFKNRKQHTQFMKGRLPNSLFTIRFQSIRLLSTFLIFFVLLPSSSFAESNDSWEVYFNDSLIGTFNDGGDVELSIKSSVIKPTDKLVIRYNGSAGVCTHCTATVNIIDEKRRKVGGMSVTKDLKKMTCILGRLKEISKSMASETLYFFYSNEQDKFDSVILKLKLV